ncbi:MAG: phage tail protein [Candidatus Hamiltonella defensa (Ceratovacuna japonica)]
MPTTVADIKADYPFSVYRFHLSIMGLDDKVGFSEVSGLEVANQTITYKDGLGFKHMPGMPEPIRLTLKRGLVKGNSTLYDWMVSVRLNRVEKRDVTLSLLDEETNPLVTWTVQNAFPTKLVAPSFNATSNDVAIEALELMADSVRVEHS